ncbi:MAG: hypothetical protein ACTIAQ_02365, partial [Glutamicibacter arilaitensis]
MATVNYSQDTHWNPIWKNHPFGGLAHNPLPLRLVIRQFDLEGCTMSNNDPNQPGQPYNPDS